MFTCWKDLDTTTTSLIISFHFVTNYSHNVRLSFVKYKEHGHRCRSGLRIMQILRRSFPCGELIYLRGEVIFGQTSDGQQLVTRIITHRVIESDYSYYGSAVCVHNDAYKKKGTDSLFQDSNCSTEVMYWVLVLCFYMSVLVCR